MACDAVCRLFTVETPHADAWLDALSEELQRVAGLPAAAGSPGVWTSLVESSPWGEGEPPAVGLAGFADETERGLVRAKAIADLSIPRFHPALPAQRPDASRGAGVVIEVKPGTLPGQLGPRPGVLAALIDNGAGGAALITATFEHHHGQPCHRAAADHAVRTMFHSGAVATAWRIVRPRARRRLLSDRLSLVQRGVLPLLLEGLSERDIAARLGRSPHTVHDYVRQIYKLLGVTSRAELILVWNSAEMK